MREVKKYTAQEKGDMKMSKVKQGQVTGHELNSFASTAHTVANRIYNIIRAVGHGELSADNALHQLVEDYHTLGQLGAELLDFSHRVPF